MRCRGGVDSGGSAAQNRRPMRVLFITPRMPVWSAYGDQRRAFAHIRELGVRHAVTSLSFEPASAAARTALAAHCEEVIVLPRSRARRLLGALAALPGREPLQAGLYAGALPPAQAAALLQRGRFDLVHMQLARLGSLLPAFAGLPCVLDLVDALSLNMARRARLDRAPARWLAALEARRLQRYERDLVAQASASAVCAAADRSAIGELPRLQLVRNGVDLDEFAFHAYERRERDIVFIGNLGYFPNVDAICWFAAQVLPLLLAAEPDLRLRLVGARPAAVLRRLAAAQPQIDLVGEVPAVQPYLARAAVAVVPLRAGSGQQFKLLEAMAAGTPVVSTALSAGVTGAVHGRELLVADAPAEMAEAILRLLRDAPLAQALALAARRFVEAEFSWRRSALELEQLWEKAVAQP
jgi:polysaccharide biosynthesis protein PslH